MGRSPETTGFVQWQFTKQVWYHVLTWMQQKNVFESCGRWDLARKIAVRILFEERLATWPVDQQKEVQHHQTITGGVMAFPEISLRKGTIPLGQFPEKRHAATRATLKLGSRHIAVKAVVKKRHGVRVRTEAWHARAIVEEKRMMPEPLPDRRKDFGQAYSPVIRNKKTFSRAGG
ncbi:hypothetical protein HAX54_014118, partial [Datura stramonium]|nr:hypothetical protein [Datura stramonium]